MGSQEFHRLLYDFLADFLDAAQTVDNEDSFRIPAGQLKIAFIHIRVVIDFFQFQPVQNSVAYALFPFIRIDQYEKGQIWYQSVHRDFVNYANPFAELAAVTLICDAGIHKAVAYHRISRFQRGTYFLSHVLGSGRRIEKSFRKMRHLLMAGIQNNISNHFAYSGPTGFPGQNYFYSFRGKKVRQHLDLCCLPRTVGAFKSNK
jgi:hypothetical protein